MPQSVIPYSCQTIDDSDIESVINVLKSNFLTQGPACAQFEEALKTVTGAEHAIAVSNGTAALHLACLAMGADSNFVGITSPITFAASANCLLYAGSEVVFCDVDPINGLMALTSLADPVARIDSRGAITPVNINGKCCELPEINKIALEKGWQVLEDAAHSLGGSYADTTGKRYQSGSCSHSTASILSFHPVKHICTGEGGAVLTNDKSVAEHIRLLRSHGIHRPGLPEQPAWFYEQIELGWNYRLTEMQAALGVSQLKRLPQFITRRRQIAQRYYEELNKAPFDHVFSLPVDDPGHVYHLFAIQCKASTVRDDLHRFLKEKNIMTQIHYIPVYKHPYYERRFGKIRLPGAEAYFKGCLSIPIYPKMTEADQDRVIAALTTFCTQG